MNVIDCIQGSPEWKAARVGRVTASCLKKVMDFTKTGKEGATRRSYRSQIVAEILTGQPQDDIYITRAMQWGTDTEPLARVAYEMATGNAVDQVGMILHPTIERAAASPDGIIPGIASPAGLVEIKCPTTATHIETLLTHEIPDDYKLQMGWQMACTGAVWCDFVSYDPRLLDERLHIFIKRFTWAEANILVLEEAVQTFLGEVHETLAILRGVE